MCSAICADARIKLDPVGASRTKIGRSEAPSRSRWQIERMGSATCWRSLATAVAAVSSLALACGRLLPLGPLDDDTRDDTQTEATDSNEPLEARDASSARDVQRPTPQPPALPAPPVTPVPPVPPV